MGNNLMVLAPEPADFIVTLEQFAAALDHWQPHAHLAGPFGDDRPADASIQIKRPDEPGFQILHFRGGDMLSTDGTREQGAEVAVWAVTTFPRTGGGELWLTDAGYTGHTVLRPGMSAEEVLNGWQEHD